MTKTQVSTHSSFMISHSRQHHCQLRIFLPFPASEYPLGQTIRNLAAISFFCFRASPTCRRRSSANKQATNTTKESKHKVMTDNNNNNLPFVGSTHSRTRNGGAGFLLKEDERTSILRALGRCDSCGRKTHTIAGDNALLVPLTNDDVFQGCCIPCNPIHFPSSSKKQTTHPYSPSKASAARATFRLVDKMKVEAI